MPAYGHLGHVGVSFQESFGTAYTSSVDYIPFISESLTEEIPPLISEGIRARYEEGNTYEGAHTIGGDLVMDIHPVLIGKFLKAWCNHGSGTLGTSEYTHQFLPGQTDWDSVAAVQPMTIEVYRGVDSSFQYYDMCVNQIALEYAYGALIKGTVSFAGGKFAWLNKTTPSFESGSVFTWNQCSLSLAGSAIDRFSNLTVTLMNNIEQKGTLNGSLYTSRAKRTGFRTIEIGGTLLFENDDEIRNFRQQTIQRLIVTATGQEVASGYNASFEVDIPRMQYTAMPANVAGPGQIEIGITGRAQYDETSSYICEFTLVNTKAAY